MYSKKQALYSIYTYLNYRSMRTLLHKLHVNLIHSDDFYMTPMWFPHVRLLHLFELRVVTKFEVCEPRSFFKSCFCSYEEGLKNSGLDRIWTWTSAMPVQCSSGWAIRPTGSWLLCGLIRSLLMMVIDLYNFMMLIHQSYVLELRVETKFEVRCDRRSSSNAT